MFPVKYGESSDPVRKLAYVRRWEGSTWAIRL